jgi:hypothetical protein
MIRPMRRWLLLAMILLLPLRGWVGDAMAAQMLQHRAVEIHAAATGSHDHDAAPQLHGFAHDCDEHARVAATEGEQAQPQAAGDCPTCASCQMCSSVALSPNLFPALGHPFSQPRPEAAQPSYASAEPALAFKPPRH